MSILLFSNNASTTISSSIGAGDTSVTLTSTAGVVFPNPGAGEYFVLSFFDAATKLITEIVWVTALIANVATIVRAQEGTTAKAWNAGDIAANEITAGQMAAMQQTANAQGQTGNSAVDSGAVNAYVATLSPNPGRVHGMPIRLLNVANTNTGASTLNVGAGVSNILGPDGSALVGGEIIAGGDYEFIDNLTSYQLSPVFATTGRSGVVVALASDAEAIAGTNTTKAMTSHAAAAVTGPLGTALAAEVARAQAAEASLSTRSAKAVITFQGRGTNGACTINNGFGYTSVSRNAAGQYAVVLSAAVQYGSAVVNASTSGNVPMVGTTGSSAIFGTSFTLYITTLASTPSDPQIVTIIVY